jgi:menaquinone-dependent protoporphyrinogen oxidase
VNEKMKVLVAFASKYGSTKGIAEFIGEKLRGHGLEVEVLDVSDAGNLASYDAFVIGSAVYMYHWMNEAKKFVSKNRAVISMHPTWLFSSGPVGTKTTDEKGQDLRKTSEPKDLDELLAISKACGHRVFFGVLDPNKQGFMYHLMRRSEAVRKEMPEGDFRNWQEIESWTDEIAIDLELVTKMN